MGAEFNEDGLSQETLAWLASASIPHRKRLGQYMTPAPLRERLLDRCDLFEGMRVLDPGVGTGEFLRSLLDRRPDAQAHGWDVDGAVLAAASRLAPEAQLSRRSALDPYQGELFDLVIGNPPYFQFNASREMRSYFARVISGRVNIFALFFQAGMEALRPGGQLAYVIPPSMNNGAYFERLREYLVEQSAVEFLEIHRDQTLFDRAQTPVQLLVLRRGERDRGRHVFVRNHPSGGFRRTLFSEDPTVLEDAFAAGGALFDLGYEAVTGAVVWNQHKSALRRRPNDRTVPLIWSRNIQGGIELSLDHKHPQFIETDRAPLVGPAIVVNRIVGAVGSAELRCALIPEGMAFTAENHVNVIRPHGFFPRKVDWRTLLAALRHPETGRRAGFLTGSTQVSAAELTHLLPLDPGAAEKAGRFCTGRSVS